MWAVFLALIEWAFFFLSFLTIAKIDIGDSAALGITKWVWFDHAKQTIQRNLGSKNLFNHTNANNVSHPKKYIYLSGYFLFNLQSLMVFVLTQKCFFRVRLACSHISFSFLDFYHFLRFSPLTLYTCHSKAYLTKVFFFFIKLFLKTFSRHIISRFGFSNKITNKKDGFKIF